MKIGYSNVLGEHVDAKDLDYEDVSDFKIVCPACREPIHKVVRESQHFLSHKQKTPGEDQECELRVAVMTREELDALDRVSRGQTLERFFRDLPDMIDRVMPRDPAGAKPWREMSELHDSNGSARRMEYQCLTFLRQNVVDEDIRKSVELGFSEKERTGVRSPTRLRRSVQRRAAVDFFRTILTPPGRRAFHHLYWAGWSVTWTRWSVISSPCVPELGPGMILHVPDLKPPFLEYLSSAAVPEQRFDGIVSKAARKLIMGKKVAPGRQASVSLNGMASNEIRDGIGRILANMDYLGAGLRAMDGEAIQQRGPDIGV